ncbi:MAG: ABC transporter permease [Planctomycetota bacterium]|jgi:peptide/nickel transport system permease protein
MRTYIVKRLLLMIPTLFGISLIVWLVVTAAPDAGQSVRSGGEGMEQSGAGSTSESRRIFRAQYNLDKPVIYNHYVDLDPGKVLEMVRRQWDFALLPSVRGDANTQLEEWGSYAVPALVDALASAESPAEAAFLVMRLATNAKRISPLPMGRALTEEEKALNREIMAEHREIEERLTLDLGDITSETLRALSWDTEDPAEQTLVAEIRRKSDRWQTWYDTHGARWEWSTGEKWRRRLFDTRFAKYWGNLIRLDLGESHVHREPVMGLILKRIPVSLVLMTTSLILAYLLSVPLGIWSAVKHRTIAEQGVTTILFMLYSLPSFFAATLLLRYLGIGQPWDIIPVQGFESPDTFHMTTWEHALDVLHHAVAPIFCLTYVSLAALSRYAKSGLLNVMRDDYIRTARAKGLSERVVVWRHAVRNGIIPIITLLGTTLPVIVGGSIIIESVFSIPGIGYLLWDSINQRDYNVVIGNTMIVAVLTMFGILLSDILYAVVDPRIRYQ